ncbi:MAG: hypothetical protein CPSOU_1863 [uncultured Paraburkholderia sp.]|nr:MAG: hypothetical protein CPSOU_1863 [uncultured Paraburkholderia sp.]
MSKARITVTFEYELDPGSYPDGAKPEEMVAIDVANYHDPDSLFDVMQYAELTVTGEAEKQAA